jgi:hypothetical protein
MGIRTVLLYAACCAKNESNLVCCNYLARLKKEANRLSAQEMFKKSSENLRKYGLLRQEF